MNTRFQYLYRDAANYKQYNEVVVSGVLKQEELFPLLWDNLFFIPSGVGLSDLQPSEWSTDDHVWHEVAKLIETTDQPSVQIDANQLLERFRMACENRWHEFSVHDGWSL